jgi:hypothetical protein
MEIYYEARRNLVCHKSGGEDWNLRTAEKTLTCCRGD